MGTATDKNIIIPAVYNGKRVVALGKRCFKDKTIVFVDIPDSVTSIGFEAFYGCRSLTSISMGNSVTSIGGNAFCYCGKLTSMVIPDSVTSIGYGAFSGCSGLTCMVIPDGVTSIGDRAFYNCSGLMSVMIPDSVTSVGWNAFVGCDNIKYNEYANALYLGNEDNPYLWLIKAKKQYIESCEINEKTKFIYGNAFYGCRVLEIITIPNNILSIGSNAFYDCNSLKYNE